MLKGPVFNVPSARHDSTPDSSVVPYSAEDVSAAGSNSRLTAEHTRHGSRSTVGDGAAVAAGAVTGSSSSGSPPGRDNATLDHLVRPGTAELDGNEIRGPLSAVAENPTGVFELPGSAPSPPPVVDGRRKTMETDRGGPSPLGSLQSGGDVSESGKHVPSRTPSPPTATSEVNPARFGRHSLVSNP